MHVYESFISLKSPGSSFLEIQAGGKKNFLWDPSMLKRLQILFCDELIIAYAALNRSGLYKNKTSKLVIRWESKWHGSNNGGLIAPILHDRISVL